MSRLMTGGIYLLLLAVMAGVWMIISPFAMDTQAMGAGWSAATINNVVVGGTLIGSALVGASVTLALQVRELARARANNPPSRQALTRPTA